MTAWVNGTQFAETQTFLDGAASVYRLDVPGDDPDTPGVEGGRDGDSVRFKVAGFDADQTATWRSGSYARLDLTANAAAVPPVALTMVTTDEDVPKPITLTAFDLNHDALTFTVVTTPTHGALSGTPPNLTYTPLHTTAPTASPSKREWMARSTRTSPPSQSPYARSTTRRASRRSTTR